MTNEEQGERYELIVSGAGVVEIFDNGQDASIQTFAGPDRLLAATAELNRLNAEQESWNRQHPEPVAPTTPEPDNWEPWTPAEFLSKKLPAVARRQRLEGHLAEVKEIEDSLVRVLAEDAANLKRATALREKLEKELETGPTSTQSAEKATGVGQDTRSRIKVLRGHAPGATGVLMRAFSKYGNDYYKVQLDGEDFSRTYMAPLIELSGTQSAEKAPGVGQGTFGVLKSVKQAEPAIRALFKPGPY